MYSDRDVVRVGPEVTGTTRRYKPERGSNPGLDPARVITIQGNYKTTDPYNNLIEKGGKLDFLGGK